MSDVPLIPATIVVQSVGKYGIQCNNQWFSVDGNGFTKESFIPGNTYVVQLRYSKTNKPYIKAVTSGTLAAPGAPSAPPAPYTPPANTGSAPAAPPPPAPAPAPRAAATPPPAAVPKSDQMSKADWARKDVVIARQAVIKSVLESPSIANMIMSSAPGNQDDYLKVVKYIAADLEAWVNRE